MTEFTLTDEKILSHRGNLLKFLEEFAEKRPDTFLSLSVDAGVLDMDVCRALSEIYCSLDIRLSGAEKGGTYLFDKRFFSRRAQTLNTLGLVFGFLMDFATQVGDGVRLFRDRLDFALSLYPNHVRFFAGGGRPKPSATFSTQDIETCRRIAFACEVFYTYGRAVPWFIPVLGPLKISPSKFLQDFSEWQKINNCSIENGWNPEKSTHSEIEKMQLRFLKFKFEEKGRADLFEVASNVVRLNGAFSRCFGEGEESVVELSFNPDELLGFGASDIQKFAENSIQENSRVRVFWDGEEARWRYC